MNGVNDSAPGTPGLISSSPDHVHIDARAPTYWQLNPRAVKYWPFRNRGRRRVVEIKDVTAELRALHSHVWEGHDTYDLTDDDVQLLTDLGLLADGRLTSYAQLRRALIEAGEPAGTLDEMSMPSAMAALQVRVRRAGSEPVRSNQTRSAPRRKANTTPDRVAQVLRAKSGTCFSYQDLKQHPDLKDIKSMRDAVGKARKAPDSLIEKSQDDDGWTVFSWGPPSVASRSRRAT